MRYICFWEIESETYDRVHKLNISLLEERKKHPEKYGKIIFPSHAYIHGHGKGFYVIEADHTQLRRASLEVLPEIKTTFIPIFANDEKDQTIIVEARDMRKQCGLPVSF